MGNFKWWRFAAFMLIGTMLALANAVLVLRSITGEFAGGYHIIGVCIGFLGTLLGGGFALRTNFGKGGMRSYRRQGFGLWKALSSGRPAPALAGLATGFAFTNVPLVVCLLIFSARS